MIPERALTRSASPHTVGVTMSDARGLQGIRGWLLLVALGLCLQPLILLKTLRDNARAFEPETWRVLTMPGSRVYHPLWAPLLIAEVVVNAALLVGAAALLYLFFTTKRVFPRAVIAFMAASFAVTLADYAVTSAIPAARAQFTAKEAADIGRSALSAAIWIPYFLRSQRVAATFVH